MLDQVVATSIRDDLDDVSLGFPDVRVLDGERLARYQRDDVLEAPHHPGMRRPGCAATDHLGAHRQVQADHAVLVEAHALEVEHPGNRRADGDIQE